jgi:feruloyl esterase
MKKTIGLSIAFLCFWLVQLNAQTTDRAIQAIKGINLPGVSFVDIQSFRDGSFTPPGSKDAINNLPPFMRVAIVSKPTPQSYIRIEIWMPEKDWNGRFLGTGNGGGAGSISYGALTSGLRCGFATANTDMGTYPHVDSLVNDYEKWVDFGHRATHEMTVAAKEVIRKYYRKNPDYSYFAGCSTGGEQALMEAQRYPDDYNGILIGAPANNRTHLHTGFLWNYRVTNETPDTRFTKEQITSITNAVLSANVGKDGGHSGDNFLTDPRMAKFDINALDTCLSKKQLEALKKIFSGPVNPVTGESIYTPIPLGSESVGSGIAAQQGDQYQHYPFRWVWGLDFDFRQFDFNKDMDKVDSILAPILNANNPDLEPVRKAGGKLLMYTGTVDPLVQFQDAVNYFERVVAAQGSIEKTQDFFRYFIVPGMDHCGGGPGLSDIGQNISPYKPQDSEHSLFISLIKWVEEGIAPDHIIATAYKTGGIRFQRPVFPYPKFPHYIGGDPALPANYQGVEHERGMVVMPGPAYLK